MLTGIWNNGQMVSNPNLAPAGSVEVHQNAKGEFEVCYSGAIIGTSAEISEANEIAITVSRGLGSDSDETYAQRYNRTTEWTARHMANDLMMMNGRDALVSGRDEDQISAAERAGER